MAKVGRPTGHWINRDAWEDLLRLSGRPVKEVVELSGVPHGTIKAIVARQDRASAEVAHKIARGVGCRVGTLFPSLLIDSERAA